jgi:hypothetical protein
MKEPIMKILAAMIDLADVTMEEGTHEGGSRMFQYIVIGLTLLLLIVLSQGGPIL